MRPANGPAFFCNNTREGLIAKLQIKPDYSTYWVPFIKTLDELAIGWKALWKMCQSLETCPAVATEAKLKIHGYVSGFLEQSPRKLILLKFLNKDLEESIISAIKALFNPSEVQDDVQKLTEYHTEAKEYKEELLHLYRQAFDEETVNQLTREHAAALH